MIKIKYSTKIEKIIQRFNKLGYDWFYILEMSPFTWYHHERTLSDELENIIKDINKLQKKNKNLTLLCFSMPHDDYFSFNDEKEIIKNLIETGEKLIKENEEEVKAAETKETLDTKRKAKKLGYKLVKV